MASGMGNNAAAGLRGTAGGLPRFRRARRTGGRIAFGGVGGKDVYNIAAPFTDGGVPVIAGARGIAGTASMPRSSFFAEREGQWLPLEGAPVLELQDPFHTRIGGELSSAAWRSTASREAERAPVAYRLLPRTRRPQPEAVLQWARRHAGSPLDRARGRDIGVFTRPQGENGGRGKIGYTRVKSLDELVACGDR